MGANAQTTVPSFSALQVLTADQQNQSARTGVPVFATTVTRDAAFGGTGEKTLAEGQLCYVEGTGLQTYNAAGAWVTWGTAPSTSAVVQIKATNKSDVFTTTSTTYTDVTGLSVSITPTSASNNILVIAAVTYGNNPSTNTAFIQLVRGSTAIAIGDAAGTRTRASNAFYTVSGSNQQAGSTVWLDSPATTSATTYKVQMRAGTAATVRVNASADDTDDPSRARTVSSIVVMEVTP